MSQTNCCYASHIERPIDDGIGLLKKLRNSTDPAWEFIYTPKLAVYVGHFVSSCVFFLFFWPKIGRYLMSLGCPYYIVAPLQGEIFWISRYKIGGAGMLLYSFFIN